MTTRKDEHYPIAAFHAALKGDLAHAGMTSADILRQEAAGTATFAAGDTLPLQGSTTPAEQATLTALGFVLGEPVDDLFRAARLPAGWRKAPSPEDSRTTLLFDAQGRKRGFVWYKAAFYDRAAYLSLTRRYSPSLDYSTTWETGPRFAVVRDQGAVIWRSDPIARPQRPEDFQQQDAILAAAKAWVAEHFPDWENPAAYWEG